MNTELIAAILKLASTQEAIAIAQTAIAASQTAIAAQLGRIADQITPRAGPAGADTGVSVLSDAVADISATLHEGCKDVVYEMQQARSAD